METVGELFERYQNVVKVIEELQKQGIERDRIGLIIYNLAGQEESGGRESPMETEDSNIGEIASQLVNLGVLMFAGGGPMLAAGPLAVTVASMMGTKLGATAGRLTSSLVRKGMHKRDAQHYIKSVQSGGALITIQISEDDATIAQNILKDLKVNLEGDRTKGNDPLQLYPSKESQLFEPLPFGLEGDQTKGNDPLQLYPSKESQLFEPLPFGLEGDLTNRDDPSIERDLTKEHDSES